MTMPQRTRPGIASAALGTLLLAHVGLSFLGPLGIIDLLWPLWDERRQTLHDKAVGCYVITNPAG